MGFCIMLWGAKIWFMPSLGSFWVPLICQCLVFKFKRSYVHIPILLNTPLLYKSWNSVFVYVMWACHVQVWLCVSRFYIFVQHLQQKKVLCVLHRVLKTYHFFRVTLANICSIKNLLGYRTAIVLLMKHICTHKGSLLFKREEMQWNHEM